MTHQRPSSRRNRVYVSRVDEALAAAMRDDGMTWAAIGDHFGVTGQAAHRIVDPEYRAAVDAKAKRYGKTACSRCGRPCSRYGQRVDSASPTCQRCRNLLRLAASPSHRAAYDEETGLWWPQVRCARCRRWLWMSEYTRPARARRGRLGCSAWCRACETEARRDYRRRTGDSCPICGGWMLSEQERRGGGSRRPVGLCAGCLAHSDDPRAVAERRRIRAMGDETVRARKAG